MLYVISQYFNAILAGYKFRSLIINVGPVPKRQYMILGDSITRVVIWLGNATNDVVDGGGTARDLDVILLSSTSKITLAEGSTKVGDIIAVEGPIVAARP